MLKNYRITLAAVAVMMCCIGCEKYEQIRISETPTEYDYHSHDFELTTNTDFNWVLVYATGDDLTREFKNDTVYHYNSWLTVKETFIHNPRLIIVHLEENDTGKKRRISIEVSNGTCNGTDDFVGITQMPKPSETEE